MLTLLLYCSSLLSSERKALALYHTPTVVLVSIRGTGFGWGLSMFTCIRSVIYNVVVEDLGLSLSLS